MQSPFHFTFIEHLYVPATMIDIVDYKYLYQWGGEREREMAACNKQATCTCFYRAREKHILSTNI